MLRVLGDIVSMRTKAVSLLIGLLFSVCAAAEEEASASETDDVFDEITVLGVRELGALRAEVTRAEDRAYTLFNELNDDDGYDVICKKETRIGSQIPQRVCQMRIVREARSEAAEDWYEDGHTARPKLVMSKHNEIFRQKLARLANENPELLEALRERLALQRKFEKAREQKFDR